MSYKELKKFEEDAEKLSTDSYCRIYPLILVRRRLEELSKKIDDHSNLYEYKLLDRCNELKNLASDFGRIFNNYEKERE